MDRVNIHGVKIHNTTMQEAVETVLHWVAGDTIHAVYTPNSEIIMQAQRNPELKNVLNEAGLLVPDGAGLILGARVLKTPLKEKVSGIDLVKTCFGFQRKKYGLLHSGRSTWCGRDGCSEHCVQVWQD